MLRACVRACMHVCVCVCTCVHVVLSDDSNTMKQVICLADLNMVLLERFVMKHYNDLDMELKGPIPSISVVHFTS